MIPESDDMGRQSTMDAVISNSLHTVLTPVDPESMSISTLVSLESPPVKARKPSPQSLLRSVLSLSSETAVAAELRVSLPALRRYEAGTLRMTWVTYTRLEVLRAELIAQPVQGKPPVRRARASASKRLERRSGSYPVVTASSMAVG